MIDTDTTLTGEKVRLRPVEERDIPVLTRWFNDPDVRYWLHRSEVPLETEDSQRERLEHNREDSYHRGWLIETLGGRPLGNVGLIGVDMIHRRAELYISIGEKGEWSAGFGTDAIRAVLRHAFTDLNLRRVTLITDIDNERGLRCYEKCGFEREGTLRAHRLRNGKPLDMVEMAILREDWKE